MAAPATEVFVMSHALRLGLALTLTSLVVTAGAQAPRLDDVVGRVNDYVAAYETQLAAVVAEESYTQTLEPGGLPESSRGVPTRGPETYGPSDRRLATDHRTAQKRILRSDYALTRVDDRGLWVGYRDTFEVDGRPVRDRDARLQQLLAAGATAQAARIAAENARFNLAEELLTRNINVPTFALELLHPRRRDRFSVKQTGTDTIDGRVGWVLEYRERDKPTIVRQPDGRDQPSRVAAVVDPIAGTVLSTTLSWERVTGSIIVTYGYVPTIPVPVPLIMSERYTTRGGSEISGEAIYSNYRRFQTGGRLIEP